jgi:hypothetical protein
MKKFNASQFTPTQWSTAVDKAKFAAHFVRFVEDGFQEKQFTDVFYKRLSNMFGHIAHYNRGGFYGEFFASLRGQLEFLEQCSQWRAYGDPTVTWSDVERELQAWLLETDALGAARRKLAGEVEKAERAQLRALAKKYPEEVR